MSSGLHIAHSRRECAPERLAPVRAKAASPDRRFDGLRGGAIASPARRRFVAAARAVLGFGLALAMGAACGAKAEGEEPLRIAVYEVPPYGYVSADGSIGGVSVDLWRRVAEQLGRRSVLIPVSEMEAILGGLEQGRFDAAIGAITITPDRLQRVDFSYPAHRSGVAVAFRRQTGPLAALSAYSAAVSELSSLIVVILAMLVLTGFAMWYIETAHRSAARESDSSVATLRDGLYWAVVTMTTVGYGDKTPKTTAGRLVAILWMLGSVVLVSLLSTTLVSRLTAERVETSESVETVDLDGKRLAAVAQSSGAEYLDQLRLPYVKYKDLPETLDALADGRSDAVVNSVGALQYYVSTRYAKVLEMSHGLLAPAYMAFALPRHSELARPIDLALIKVTGGREWRKVEDRFFGK